MGKTCSKDAQEEIIMENTSDSDYKTRLNKKLVISKEHPEPIFDVSDCNLESLPISFAFLRVLRKEILILGKNRLKSLDGGDWMDLELLKVLDLSHNKFKAIPAEICHLINLKELFISHNLLTRLPPVFNRLRKLEILDISHNDLCDIRSISFMSNLKILNISSNHRLEALPPEIATNESLYDLIFDIENIKSPSAEILATANTQNILKYLSTGELTAPSDYAIEDNLLKQQSKITSSRIIDEGMSSATKKFIQLERTKDTTDADVNELHREQQKRKEEMLKTLMTQQKQTELAINKVHQVKDFERKMLIENIKQYEEYSSVVVNELLSLKKGPDAALLELEEIALDALLLEKAHFEQSELRKKDVLSAMSELFEQEHDLITNYTREKSESSKKFIENETKNNLMLNEVFEEFDKNRMQLVEKINQDEEWQKSAVATLISKNDARSWGIVEQIRIVEAQIAKITNYEIDKKKANQEDLLNDVGEKRTNLTLVLLDLIDQQEKRKKQLLETLTDIENQRTEDDFWLIQYQKLLDQRNVMQNSQASIPIDLGQNFLLHGVIHVLPFLLKIWNRKDFCLEKVSDEDLKSTGIKNKKDREGVLRAISDFLSVSSRNSGALDDAVTKMSCAKEVEIIEEDKSLVPSAPQESPSKASMHETITNPATECVICMDSRTRVIFLPCGHLCCCLNCSKDLTLCPMCRGEIERRIKVIPA